MKNLKSFILAILVGCLLLGPSLGWSQPKRGGTINFGIEMDIRQDDPHQQSKSIEGRFWTFVCDSLVNSDKNFEPQPALAESWKSSPDAKVWTFQLRKGVKFHNGRELTATDVKWNIERIKQPKFPLNSFFKTVETVDAVDKYTVKFTLKSPMGNFLSAFCGAHIQASIIAPESAKADGSVSQAIGTGPFIMVEHKTDDYIKLKKFKDYWGKGRPYVDEIILRIIPDDTVRLAALKSGDIQMTYKFGLADAAKLKKNPDKDFKLDLFGLSSPTFIHMNIGKPPFNDVRVRKAVALALNKQDVLEGVSEGLGEVCNQHFVKASFWHVPLPEHKQDLDKAKALLKEAGYPDGLDVSIVATSTYSYLVLAAEVVQAQLAKIGMRAKLETTEFTSHWAMLRKGEFQFGTMSSPVVADPDFYYPYYYTPEGGGRPYLNGGVYQNPKVTELLTKGREVLDRNKRKEYYTEALRIIFGEDVPSVFIFVSPAPAAWRNEVKGYETHINHFFCYAGGGMQYAWLEK